jgi:hypothetical protein
VRVTNQAKKVPTIGAGDGDARGKKQRVEQCLVGIRFAQDIDQIDDIQTPIHPQRIDKDQQHRHGDKNDQNANRQAKKDLRRAKT